MDNEKVIDLPKKAKRLGLKGFKRLRKQELIDRIRTATNILDEEIPDIDSPVLSPTRYVKKKPPEQTTEQQKKEIRELEEMLGLRKTRTCVASASLSTSALPEIKITDPE